MARALDSTGPFGFAQDDDGNHRAHVAGDSSSATMISVKTFCGKVYVDIRDYFSTSDGKLQATRRGVSLTKDEWCALCNRSDELRSQIIRLKENLDAGKAITDGDFFKIEVTESLLVTVGLEPIKKDLPDLSVRVKIEKRKGNTLPITCSAISLTPLAWQLIAKSNRDQTDLILASTENQAAASQARKLNYWQEKESKLYRSFLGL